MDVVARRVADGCWSVLLCLVCAAKIASKACLETFLDVRMFLTILWRGFSFLALCLLFVRAGEVAVKRWERRREVRKSTGVEEGWCGGWDVKEVEEEEEKEGKTKPVGRIQNKLCVGVAFFCMSAHPHNGSMVRSRLWLRWANMQRGLKYFQASKGGDFEKAQCMYCRAVCAYHCH